MNNKNDFDDLFEDMELDGKSAVVVTPKGETKEDEAIPNIEHAVKSDDSSIPSVDNAVHAASSTASKDTGKSGAKTNKKTKSEPKPDVDVVDVSKYEKEIASLKEQVEDLKLQNKLVIDAQNTDERKKVMELLKEGKIIVGVNNKPFILAEQPSPLYNSSNPVIHRIICTEIKHVTIRKYYADLELMPKGKRTIIREVIWAYHEGYASQSIIEREQLDYLLDNGFIKSNQVFYAHHDTSTGKSIFLSTDSREPSQDDVVKLIKKEDELYTQKAKKVKIEDVPVMEEQEEEAKSNLDLDIDNMEIAADKAE